MFQSLRIASRSAALTLLVALLGCVAFSPTNAATASHGDIVVVTVHGTVSATMAGMTVPLSAGAILELPATVRTGADGAVELRQGPSTFAAAGNTELEIPQSAAEGGLIERIIQIRGNAFYSIGKRTGTRLRVEAPYLVAVIKGTQFNVAAQEDSTTIALFEGHLEVRASDDSDVVDLNAGEIAIRRRNDVTISVLRLNAARGDMRRNPEMAARQQADASNSTASSVVARGDNPSAQPRLDTNTTTDTVVDSGIVATPGRERVVDAIADTGETVIAKPAIDLGGNDSKGVETAVDAGVSAVGGAVSVAADVATTVDVGAGTVAAAGDVGVAVGPVSADVGASAAIDVPDGTVAAAGDLGVAAGPVSADVGASAVVDVPDGTVAAAGDVGVAAGPVSADIGASAAVDVPDGTVDVGVSGAVAATDAVSIDTSVAAAADVPAGTVNVGTDTSVTAAGLPVDAGVAAAVDASAGTADVGVDTSVASTDVGAAVGVDAGTGSVGADVDVGSLNVGVDVGTSGVGLDVGTESGGGLLGGLGGLLGGDRKRN
jgi:hypothetical protein